MTMSETSETAVAKAALAALGLLHLVMLFALYFGVDPHPPERVAPFAMGPFLGATLAVLAATALLKSAGTRAGRAMAGLAIVMSLVSFGPQKVLDPAFPLIWPAVVTAWVAICALGVLIARSARHDPAAT